LDLSFEDIFVWTAIRHTERGLNEGVHMERGLRRRA
jgi:hypothetical protein